MIDKKTLYPLFAPFSVPRLPLRCSSRCSSRFALRLAPWLTALTLILLACFSTLAQANNQIDQLRANAREDKLQIVLDTKTAPTFNAFALSNPTRIVVDVTATPATGYKNTLAFKNRGVSRVRTGQRSDNETRIVLDLNVDYRWQVYAMRPEGSRGHRVVIDVFDQGGQQNKQPTRQPTPNPNTANQGLLAIQLESLTPGDPDIKQTPTPQPASQPSPAATNASIALATTAPKSAPPRQDNNSNNSNTIASINAPTIDTTAVVPNKNQIVIMIDPGHGGKDPGAIGPGGTYEKDIVLQVGKRLQKKIDAMPNKRAVMTRSTDKYLTLRQRLALARKHNADLFVSIHADACAQCSASGSSVYILSTRGASSEAARWLAQKHTADELKYGVDINDYDKDISKVLMQIQQDATIESSYVLAKKTLRHMKAVGRNHKKQVERAGFAVLKSPDIPSILVETAFISNAEEEKKLKTTRYQEKIATAIAEGVEAYFQEHLPQHLLLINAP
ncbi:N-acetylmuramoyl-L-alanine amidase [Ostreibacterium oceani]|uniref:N-acetylmuramoyl-L-alanine amidase AmiC n=1 Tax=Ostreibacterium oceani TaxID=2654998 RepID=A0A6N7EVY3_9GAMM|nr:N-acetylmuramoyl-L-alanine amidase [Ostreibacterium oceani]MPV86924.1 AMIN domain-containing protein [Ostreibacterium oceani]